MYGYINVYKDELKIKDYNLYRVYYCALCRQISKYSQLYRLLLSFDFTFLSVATNALSDKYSSQCRVNNHNCHCQVSCFKKNGHNDMLDFISAFSIIMQFQKILDNINDGEKRYRIFKFIFKKGFKKASKEFPELVKLVESKMNELSHLENSSCNDIEKLEDCFASIFKEAAKMMPLADCDSTQPISEVLYHIAAWLYLVDMFDDIEEDIKKNTFNPLKNLEYNQARQLILSKALCHLEKVDSYFQILPYSETTNIINNIIGFGLPMKMKKIGLISN